MSSTPDDRPVTRAGETEAPAQDDPAAATEQTGQDALTHQEEPAEQEVPTDRDGATQQHAPTRQKAPAEQDAPAQPDAPAAQAGTAGEETLTARARIRRSLVKPAKSQLVVGVLLAVLGFAAVAQVQSTDVDDTYEGRRQEELIEIFNGLTGTSDRARRDIARLEQTRRDLQVDTSARRTAIEQAEQRLETLNILAGLVPVTGPGLKVTVTETGGRVSVESLLDMVQELRTAGAEAMEFNQSVRLVASSSFSLVDDVIHVDGQPLRSPYVLEVIGDSSTLHAGLTFPSGPVSTLRNEEGADVAIEDLDAVDIESLRELPGAEFAERAEGQ